jgi:hypothetical protein
MENIKSLRDSHQRNDEHFQRHATVIKLVVKYGADVLKVALEFPVYEAAFVREDEAFKRVVKSLHTEEMQEEDTARDNILRAMRKINDAALLHFNEDVSTAAKRLKILYDTFGNVIDKPIYEETSAITNMLQELRGTYAADVAKTGVGEWVVELEIHNTRFENFSSARVEEEANKTHLVMKQCRIQTDAAYHNMVKKIDAMFTIDGADVHRDFITELNLVTEKFRNAMAQREGRRKANHQHSNNAGKQDI